MTTKGRKRMRGIVIGGGGLALLLALGYWRGSKVSWISASREVTSSPEQASSTILAPGTLPKYFAGVREVDAEPAWPALGSSMTWKAGPGGRLVFTARVLENRLPGSIRLAVRTPSADSLITQRFEKLGEGRTRYEKVCEVRHRGFNKVIGPILTMVIQRSLDREVERAAAAVEQRL
jgi:hypothetical protein